MKNREFIFLILVILVGAVIRIDLLAANHFVIDSDEAIVGLMAKHILEGQSIPVFYYGQHYMGSLESICASLVFSLFGISGVTLKIVPFAFSLLMILAIYDLTLQSVNKRAARIAALFCALPPSALVVWSSMARGGFIELILIGALSFCLLARWLKLENGSDKLIIWQGLLLGLGWWVNNQILYFMLPTAIVITGRILYSQQPYFTNKISRLFIAGFKGLLAWLIGSLPYWIYNIQNDWASLGMFSPAAENKLGKHIVGLFSQALPIIFGGSRFWQAQDIYPGSISIVMLANFFLLFCLLCIRSKSILKIFKIKFGPDSMPETLLLFLFCCVLVFVFSSFGWLSQAPRYLLPMYVGIFPLVALVLDKVLGLSRIVGSFMLVLLLLFNVASSYFGGRSIPGEPVVFKGDRVLKDHSELLAWLKTNHIDWVRTNYWIGYRLAFETLEKTRFIVAHEPSQTRIESWAIEAKKNNIEKFPVLAVSTQARYIRKALEILHIEYKEQILSGYHVFYDLHPVRVQLKKIAAEDFKISTNFKSENIGLAVDGQMSTRWGSGQSQKPDMQIRVDFNNPVNLAGITYELGNFATDYPRALQIEFILADGSSHLYFAEDGWESIKYFMQFSSELPLYFPTETVKSVIFKQVGKDAIFDWSVAELEFYEEAK